MISLIDGKYIYLSQNESMVIMSYLLFIIIVLLQDLNQNQLVKQDVLVLKIGGGKKIYALMKECE